MSFTETDFSNELAYRWVTTKDDKWIDKWNELVLADESSSFLQSLYRVKAYEKYGIEWELLICIDNNNNILFGSVNTIVKFSIFKLYICSYGPTFNSYFRNDKNLEEYYLRFNKRAQELNVFVSQLTIPIGLRNKCNFTPCDGIVFRNITSPRYNNIINLKNEDKWITKDELVSNFLPKGRRDVRASYRKGLVSRIPKNENDLRVAYSCLESNANNKGYRVRNWDEMRDFIVESVKNKMAFMITAWYNDEIQGAVLLERSHNMLSYTMGGVYRRTPDLLTGYFLQVEAMVLSQKLGLNTYDISYGGPKEIQRFKSMFNPELKERYKTIYFKHSYVKFIVFKVLYEKLKHIIPKLITLKKKLKN